MTGVVPAARGLAAAESFPPFPQDFLWGYSTSSYQIEGATEADGRGPSIWDSFGRIPGKIVGGDTGASGCDHYRRYAEDVELLAGSGVKAYRFSTAWSRILPQGTGGVNAAGLDFYDRLVDALLAKGIEPWPCLYHWDLPQALQDKGGWLNRDIADWFADYAVIVARRLGDRVGRWVMLNEPGIVAQFGHGVGEHAPGLRGPENWLAALHHQNLAQGRALSALRAEARPAWRLGTVLSVQPVRPVDGREANRPAAALFDALWNRSGLDPLLLGRYPSLLLAQGMAALVKDGDLAAIHQPIDFLGINYYSRVHAQPDRGRPFGVGFGPAPKGTPVTGMGWPVEPDGLHEQLLELRDRYGNPPVYIAENGADYYDWIGPEGKAEDGERIAYLKSHLAAAQRAIADGTNLKGYFVWTLLDNFEWAAGYAKHFGTVAVDRATMKRTPKASYYWYRDVVRGNALRA